MFGGVRSKIKTRHMPAGMFGHQLSFHYICGEFMKSHSSFSNNISLGGNTVDACNIKVNIEEKSALSYSKTVLWELEDSKKAIGAANLLSSTWNHVTIDLPASSKETLITMEVEHNYDLFGGSGIDNMVISSTRKCNPRYHQTVSFK